MSLVEVDIEKFEKQADEYMRDLAHSAWERQENAKREGITKEKMVARAREVLGDVKEVDKFERGGPRADRDLVIYLSKLGKQAIEDKDYDRFDELYGVTALIRKLEAAAENKDYEDHLAELKSYQDEIIKGSERNAKTLQRELEAAVKLINDWPGYKVIARPQSLDPRQDIWPADDFTVFIVTKGRADPSFTVFTKDGKVYEVEDVLDGGDHDFFHGAEDQAAYFDLVSELMRPGSTSRPGKDLVLYTARPAKDRAWYEGAHSVPTNIFLTNDPDRAAGIAHDLGSGVIRDIWRVVINEKNLIQTLDSGRVKDYQAVGKGHEVPIKKISPWMVGESSSVPLIELAGPFAAVVAQYQARGWEILLFDDSDGRWELSKIVVPEDERGQGAGSAFMRAIGNIADRNGITITGTPSKDFGATSLSRLKAFYQDNGFVENRGEEQRLWNQGDNDSAAEAQSD